METTKMKIEYRKQIDSETAPWQLLTNMDELLWNGIYNLRVTDDDGTHSLPFRFANDDTVTLVVKDHAHEGMLENGRTIVHTITRVERSTGNVLSYTRTRYNSNGSPTWSYWTLAGEDDAVIEIPKATPVSLGAVIVGDGLAVDADGKLSVAGKSIGEEHLTSALNDKINVAATKANATDLFVQNSGLALHYGALLRNDAPYAGTNLRVYTDKILSAGEQFVVNDGYIISALKIFDGEQEIAYADNLNEKEYSLDAKGMHYQFEFSKLNITPFTDDELPQVIKAYHRRPIVWSSAHHINHFVAAGTYNIVGQRTNSADGLPIANAASGHSINARLVVLDSSIPGSGKESDKCITQILALSNRTGAQGDIYVRTGRAADTAHLIAGNGWGAWGKLQQNIEVGQTTSLDGYVNNGIYSGVYTNGTTLFETFVMVVINNYAVAAVAGTARSIMQVKYAVDTNGAFCYMVRTGQGTDVVEWGEWNDLDSVITTNRIQDGAVTAQKLSTEVRERLEKIPSLEQNVLKEKSALTNGDTIVGLAREIYSRQGKTDISTFLKRTTAGGTTVSDGVASLKQIGGFMVRNIVDASSLSGWKIFNNGNFSITNEHNVFCVRRNGAENLHLTWENKTEDKYIPDGHLVYYSCYLKCAVVPVEQSLGLVFANGGGGYIGFASWAAPNTNWQHVSFAKTSSANEGILGYSILNKSNSGCNLFYFTKPLYIDLTEMFGVGNEPSLEECDRIFGTMDALPKGLTIASPTGFKSTGYNQWNPANIFTGKTITDNTIVDGDKSIAFIECLPCKIGAGENNGYVIGYGEGDEWSDVGIEVYLTPIYPMTNDGLLYAHKLEKNATTGTYIPQIKGYMLVVTPVTNKLCMHLCWSGDRNNTDYEEYLESTIAFPEIPQMSEWGLAGISTTDGFVQDIIDLENKRYIKRLEKDNDGNLVPLAIAKEYPIVTKMAPNYIGSDYGTETFLGSKVPLNANILFYMRSLVGETRNFLDRLMAGLGTSDATTAADRIVAAITSAPVQENIED